jgi:hypothetical protein
LLFTPAQDEQPSRRTATAQRCAILLLALQPGVLPSAWGSLSLLCPGSWPPRVAAMASVCIGQGTARPGPFAQLASEPHGAGQPDKIPHMACRRPPDGDFGKMGTIHQSTSPLRGVPLPSTHSSSVCKYLYTQLAPHSRSWPRPDVERKSLLGTSRYLSLITRPHSLVLMSGCAW